MRRIGIVLALALVGCGSHGMMPAWKSGGQLSPEEEASARRVIGVADYQTIQAWEASPWWKPGDMMQAPIYVALTYGRMACLIPAADWVILHNGDRYPCQGSWRFARS